MLVDIEEMERWIKDNIKEIHSIYDVANHWNSSPETIRKEFWRKEKRALSDFIINEKIETAKRLLIETDLLCKQVCFESGFHREDTGAEIFKQRVGVTMTQFRLQHGGR